MKWREKYGLPAYRKRIHTAGTKAGKIAHIRVNIGENCNTRADEMLWKTFAACKIANNLEAMGIRVKITAEIRCARAFKKYPDKIINWIINIKNHENSLNIGAIATALSPWSLRFHYFIACQKFYKELRTSLGQAKTIERKGNEIVIDCGECLSKQRAIEFINNVKIG